MEEFGEVQEGIGTEAVGSPGDRDTALPVIRSMRPGALDLSRFDFDDLLT